MKLDPVEESIDRIIDCREDPLAAKLMFCTLHQKSYKTHTEQEAREDDGIVDLAVSDRIDRLIEFLQRFGD